MYHGIKDQRPRGEHLKSKRLRSEIFGLFLIHRKSLEKCADLYDEGLNAPGGGSTDPERQSGHAVIHVLRPS